MTLTERATELQRLLWSDGINATHQECTQLLLDDLIIRINQNFSTEGLDTVSV